MASLEYHISRLTSPFRLKLSHWKQIGVRIFFEMIDMDTSLRCAGVAYFCFLSIFPAIAIVVLLFGLLVSPNFLYDQIYRLEYILPDIALDIISERLHSLVNQPASGLGIGLAISTFVALWSGSRGMNALIYTATATYNIDAKRGFIKSVVISVAGTLGGALFMLVSLILIAAVPIFFQLIPIDGLSEAIALSSRWPLLIIIAIIGFMLLYRFTLKRNKERIRIVWPGALLAASLWIVVSWLFSFYVENFAQFESSFGSLAAAVVLLLWLYNSALIVVLGARFNAEIESSANEMFKK